MFNKFAATCYICGARIPPGYGVVLNVGKRGEKPIWAVECNDHLNWNQVKKEWRPKKFVRDLKGEAK